MASSIVSFCAFNMHQRVTSSHTFAAAVSAYGVAGFETCHHAQLPPFKARAMTPNSSVPAKRSYCALLLAAAPCRGMICALTTWARALSLHCICEQVLGFQFVIAVCCLKYDFTWRLNTQSHHCPERICTACSLLGCSHPANDSKMKLVSPLTWHARWKV